MGNRKRKRDGDSKIVRFFQDSESFYRMGLKAYRKKDLRLASKLVKRAVELEPDNEEMMHRLASIYTELGEYEKSNELLTYILHHMNQDSIECYYFLANNYAHLGLFQKAYQYALLYHEKAPKGIFAEENNELLDMLEMDVQVEDSIEYPENLIEKQEKARFFLENGQFRQAISLLDEIIADYPEFWSAHNNKALAHFYSGEVDLAKRVIFRILQKNPGNLHALCNLLVFSYYEGDDIQVHSLANMLKGVYPILFEHQYKLGATFALIGYYRLAFQKLYPLYRKGFEGDDTFYYWLSYSAYFIGQQNLAKKIWKKVLEINPLKDGAEPWNAQNDSNRDNIPERLLSIYYAMKTNQRKKLMDEQQFETILEKTAIQYVLAVLNGEKPSGSSAVQFAFHVADCLMEQTMEGELLALYWFQLFIKAYEEDIKFRNVKAWASAVHYLWTKKMGRKITQADCAKRFDISDSTLSKYIQVAKKLDV